MGGAVVAGDAVVNVVVDASVVKVDVVISVVCRVVDSATICVEVLVGPSSAVEVVAVASATLVVELLELAPVFAWIKPHPLSKNSPPPPPPPPPTHTPRNRIPQHDTVPYSGKHSSFQGGVYFPGGKGLLGLVLKVWGLEE